MGGDGMLPGRGWTARKSDFGRWIGVVVRQAFSGKRSAAGETTIRFTEEWAVGARFFIMVAMSYESLAQKIGELADPALKATGLELVDVEISALGRRLVVRIVVDKDDRDSLQAGAARPTAGQPAKGKSDSQGQGKGGDQHHHQRRWITKGDDQVFPGNVENFHCSSARSRSYLARCSTR